MSVEERMLEGQRHDEARKWTRDLIHKKFECNFHSKPLKHYIFILVSWYSSIKMYREISWVVMEKRDSHHQICQPTESQENVEVYPRNWDFWIQYQRFLEVDVGCGEFYSQSVIIIKSVRLMNSKILLKFNRNRGMILRSCACKIIEGLICHHSAWKL